MRHLITDKQLSDVWRINLEVNNKYPWEKEKYTDMMKASDLRITKKGSCGDFAYTKMLMLMEEGISSDSLGIATCEINDRDERRGKHAVLLLSTDRGDYILDNRKDFLLTMSEFESMYAWRSVPKHITGNG